MPHDNSPSASASVIICTYNRCESLGLTLESLCRLDTPRGFAWELIVVDNNSNDATKQVCERFAAKLPVRYFFEARLGKSTALNRGIAESAGDLILFTDDDVNVDKHWLLAIADGAKRHPAAVFFGGKVLPDWEAPPPKWVIENLDWLHINVHVDKGQTEAPIKDFLKSGDMPFFVGANMACRKEVFRSGLSFREDIGPAGSDHSMSGNLRGEEIDLEERLLAMQAVGIYLPSAVVYHRHPAHRQTERYVRKYYFGGGVAEIRRSQQCPVGRYWFGAPRYLWKRLAVNSAKYVLTRPWAQSRTWLSAEKAMASTWGAITECRRLSSHDVAGN